MRKAIALSCNLNKIKAWKAVAAVEAEQSNLGVACADLQVQPQVPLHNIALLCSVTCAILL